MKNILVPTDFSESARHATHFGYQLAKKAQGELTILHVMEIGPVQDGEYYISGQLINRMSQECEEKLKAAAQPFADKIATHTFLMSANAMGGVKNSITQMDSDIIVLGGHHDATSLSHAAFGSTIENVIRSTKCPIVNITGNTRLDNITNVLIAFDPETFNEFTALELKEVLNLDNHHLTFLWVDKVSGKYHIEELEQFLESHMEKIEFRNYTLQILKDLSVEHGIVNAIETLSPDLLVLTTHGRSGLKRFFYGSISEKLVGEIAIPSLILHLRDEVN
ncbi:MAG: universal stress protein [Cyclobacteriaceae bacterium]